MTDKILNKSMTQSSEKDTELENEIKIFLENYLPELVQKEFTKQKAVYQGPRNQIEVIERIVRMEAEIVNIKERIVQMDQKIVRVEERIVQMDQRIVRVEEGLTRQGDLIEKLINQMDKRFEQVDKRFEQMDKRFEQMDKRFEQMDKRFEQLTKRIDRFMIWSFSLTISVGGLVIILIKYM